jgi:hypothetical protein
MSISLSFFNVSHLILFYSICASEMCQRQQFSEILYLSADPPITDLHIHAYFWYK